MSLDPSLIKMNSAGTTLSLSETQHFFNLGLEATTTFEATRTTTAAKGIKTIFNNTTMELK
jgi:hypothetical protein